MLSQHHARKYDQQVHECKQPHRKALYKEHLRPAGLDKVICPVPYVFNVYIHSFHFTLQGVNISSVSNSGSPESEYPTASYSGTFCMISKQYDCCHIWAVTST